MALLFVVESSKQRAEYAGSIFFLSYLLSFWDINSRRLCLSLRSQPEHLLSDDDDIHSSESVASGVGRERAKKATKEKNIPQFTLQWMAKQMQGKYSKE